MKLINLEFPNIVAVEGYFWDGKELDQKERLGMGETPTPILREVRLDVWRIEHWYADMMEHNGKAVTTVVFRSGETLTLDINLAAFDKAYFEIRNTPKQKKDDS